jgi:hypothetical protein
MLTFHKLLLISFIFFSVFFGVVFTFGIHKVEAATPTFNEVTAQAEATATNSVVVSSVPGGTDQLYIAVVAFYTNGGTPGTSEVNTMSGGSGLSWSLITGTVGCSGRISQPRTEMWWAYGSPSSFNLTANLKNTTLDAGAHVAVSRISGADNSMPINGAYSNTNGGSGACSGGSDNANATISATVTNTNSLMLNQGHPRNSTYDVIDANYSQQYFVENTSGGAASTIGIYTRSNPPTGSHTIAHTVAADKPWTMGVIEINEAPSNPVLTQNDFRFYANGDDVTPTSSLAATNSAPTLTSTSSAVRLRMNVSVSTADLATTTKAFKLQWSYATTSGWQDVGTATSSDTWRFYNNPSVATSTTITSLLLGTSEIKETYEEQNSSASNPNAIATSQDGEWDFVLDPTSATNTTYYFRMVEDDNATFSTYTNYPSVVVNVPNPPDLTQIHYRWRNDDGGEGDWWSSSWLNRRKITFDNASSSENLVDFPVLVSLNATNSSNIDYSKTLDSGEDIRFVDQDGSTSLQYEIEDWDESATSTIWVKVPQIDATSTTDHIWMYYNNTGASDNSTTTGVWDSNFVGVWHMDNDTSASTTDSTANAHHGSTNGPTATSSGFVDGALDFALANNPVVDLGTSSTLNNINPITICAMIYARTLPNDPRIFRKADGTGGNGKVLLLDDSVLPDELHYRSGFSITDGEWRSPLDSISANTWYYGCVSHDNSSTSNNPAIYIDGSSVAVIEMTAPDGDADSDSAYSAMIGNKPGLNRDWDGIIDEVRVSSTSRSADWIEAEYKTMNLEMNTFSNEEEKWWDSSWLNRRKITFDNSSSSENLVNFPILVSLNATNSSNIDYSKTQDNGEDIRFVDADGTTSLQYEIEDWDESATSTIWVKVPQIDASSQADYVWMYYNNIGASDTSTTTGVWDSNYVGVWHLDNLSSASASDSTVNGHNGSMIGPPTATSSGQANGALDFDGDSTYISIASSSDFDKASSSPFTMSAWYRRTGGAGHDMLLSISYGVSSATYALEVRSDTSINYWDGTSHELISTVTMNLGEWNYIATTVENGTSGTMYFNGSQTDAASVDNTVRTATEVMIGNSNYGGSEVLGSIDEVRFSSISRSADWIEASYKTMNLDMNTFSNEQASSSNVTGASWLVDEDTATSSIAKDTNIRLRTEISNEGAGDSGSIVYQLEYSTATTSGWTTMPASGQESSEHWVMATSSYITDGANTSDHSGISNENNTFVQGSIHDETSTTSGITLTTSQFTELEFSIKATSNANDSGIYYFRLTNQGSITNFSYDVYPTVTLAAAGVDLDQIHYRWRNDDDNEMDASFATSTDSVLLNLKERTKKRLRIEVSNEGGVSSSAVEYRLEYGRKSASCAGIVNWIPLVDYTQALSQSHWSVVDSSYFGDGASTTNVSVGGGIADENTTFLAGQIKDITNLTDSIILGPTQFTELEFSIWAEHEAADAGTYCFRVTNNGSTTNFTYSVYPEVLLTPQIRSGSTAAAGGGAPIATAVGWWDASWLDRKKITFDNASSSENLIDFPMLVALNPTNLSNIDYSKTQNNGEDIRFVDSNNVTALQYEIEKWDESGTSSIWVKIPQIDALSTTSYIWMYYNNTGASDNSTTTGVWNSNYVGVWHLDEDPSQATSTLDSTANANNGSSSGAMVLGDQVEGKVDGSLDFDGSDDSIRASDSNSLDITTAYAITAWINPRTFGEGNFGRILQKGNSSSNRYVYYTNSDELGFTRNGTDYETFLNSIQLNIWQYVGVTYDGTTLRFYINGSEDPATYTVSALSNNGDPLYIGNRDTADRTFDGIIDEVRISNAIRSADWIEASYKTMNLQFSTYSVDSVIDRGAGGEATDGDPADTETVGGGGQGAGGGGAP